MAVEQSPSDIYTSLLLPKRHGYPLWNPEPRQELSQEYRSVGVDIGDVGMITYDGRFDFHFNICHDASHPINWQGVPDNFVPLTVSPEDISSDRNMYNVGTHISSAQGGISKTHIREWNGDVR